VGSGWRLLLVVVGAGAAVLLFLVFRGEDEKQPPAVQPTTSVVSIIRPPPQPPQPQQSIPIPLNTDAVTRATIPRGRRVVLVVSGAAGEEIHLHGYDVKRRVGPDGIVRLAFRATIPGRFEVELEDSHRQIADLTVRP
jgi:hypothetical protein